MEEYRKRKLQDPRRNTVPRGVGVVIQELMFKFLVVGDFGVGEFLSGIGYYVLYAAFLISDEAIGQWYIFVISTVTTTIFVFTVKS